MMKKILILFSVILMMLMPPAVSADVSRVSPIKSASTIEKGYYALRPKCNPVRALTMNKYSSKLYATTVSHTYTKNKAQIFYIEPSTLGPDPIKDPIKKMLRLLHQYHEQG